MLRKFIARSALGGIIAGNLIAAAATVLFYAFAQTFIDGAPLAVATALFIGVTNLVTTAAAILIVALLRAGSPLSEALGIKAPRGFFGIKASIIAFAIASFVTGAVLFLALLLHVGGITLAGVLVITFVSAFVPAGMFVTAGRYLIRPVLWEWLSL